MLKNINWPNLIAETTDNNNLITKFLDLLDTHYDECFLIMTKQAGSKRISKPWLTKER